MSISRRQFNMLALAAAGSPFLPAFAQNSRFSQPLPIPELIDASARSGAASLTIQKARHTFAPGLSSPTYGYSASYLGPTVRLPADGQVQMQIANKLGRMTTVHWHGLKVPGRVDGGPHNAIADGTTWRPVLSVKQPACTAWYHAHPHRNTAHQVYGGLAGMLIVADGSDAGRGLPHEYGIDDLPLVIQDRSFARDGELLYDTSHMTQVVGFYGETIIVNGAIDPVAKVPAKLVRLRILNGANASSFRIAFSDSRMFRMIASDSGFLSGPLPLREILVSPGERIELLADFSDGKPVELVSLPYTVPARGMMGMMMNRNQRTERRPFLRFAPDTNRRKPNETVPASLGNLGPPESGRVRLRRRLSLDMMMGMGGMMGRGMGMGMGRGMGRGMSGAQHAINGRPFDMERVDFSARQGDSEIWTIEAPDMPHPFHVHGTSFRILSLNGRAPPPELSGLKDTVLVDGSADILVPFDVPASRDHPYMFHCHILEHEDGGMMGQFAVA